MENGNHAGKVHWLERVADLVVGLLLAYPTVIGLFTIATALLKHGLLLAGIFLLSWSAAIGLYAWILIRKVARSAQVPVDKKETHDDGAV